VTASLWVSGWVVAGLVAVAAWRMRRRLELVARAAHELRGPATAMALAVTALRREPGGLRRALAFEGQLERMRSGLDDLEAARAGRRAKARPRALGLERLARGTAAAWRPAAHTAGRRLRFRWDGAPAVVRADPGRLSQALGNLVANAVEHGSGPVELRGRRAGGKAIVEVRDGGPAGGGDGRRGRPTGVRAGLPAESRAARRDRADRGRGLAIAALAVEEAGGRLAIECREGETTAAVELPLAEP